MSDTAETKLYEPPAALAGQAHVSGRAAYDKLVAEAEADYEGYWARLARELVSWKTPFTQVLDQSEAPFFEWFADGTLNVSYNCLDRNIERGLGDKTAIIFEADDGAVTKVTYKELLSTVSKFANVLKARGVKFEVCEITLKNRGLKKDQFIMDADFTPSGVVRITQLQQRDHYAYLKP